MFLPVYTLCNKWFCSELPMLHKYMILYANTVLFFLSLVGIVII